MRLRPSGSSGILVSHIEAFGDYQQQVLGRPRAPEKLAAEVADMREKMRKELMKPENGVFDLKQDTGAMVDIEFLVQYLVLLNSHKYAGLLKWTDNVRLIQSLIDTGILDEITAHVLKHAYLIYRAAAHQLSLQEKPAKVPREKFDRLQRRVEEIWQSYFKSE